jgi:hypothetical protein
MRQLNKVKGAEGGNATAGGPGRRGRAASIGGASSQLHVSSSRRLLIGQRIWCEAAAPAPPAGIDAAPSHAGIGAAAPPTGIGSVGAAPHGDAASGAASIPGEGRVAGQGAAGEGAASIPAGGVPAGGKLAGGAGGGSQPRFVKARVLARRTRRGEEEVRVRLLDYLILGTCRGWGGGCVGRGQEIGKRLQIRKEARPINRQEMTRRRCGSGCWMI